MWQRFTERARRVVFFAQAEAHRRGESAVSAEHLLLGILHEEDNVACRVLERLGVARAVLRAELVGKLKPSTKPNADREMQLSLRAKRVIDLAYDEARQLNNAYIGSEHLLLGLLRDSEGLAGPLLERYGATLDMARAEVKTLQEGPSTTPAPAWSRLTERARRVMTFAQEEAGRLGQATINTEHFLLGLTRESDTVAARLLDHFGVSLRQVRTEVERQLARGSADDVQEVQLSHTGKRVLDLAYEEAQLLRNNFVGTEHLLLGLIREGDGLAGRALAKLGVGLEPLREQVKKLQDEQIQPTPVPPSTPAPLTALPYDPLVQALVVQLGEEARSLGEHYASTEHILLALVRHPHPTLAPFFIALGVAPQRILQELERQIASGSGSHSSAVTLTPRARRVFDLAYDEARTLGLAEVGLVPVLLGLLREREGLAGRVLSKLGITLERAQRLARTENHPESVAARLRELGAEVLLLAPHLAEVSPAAFREALLGSDPESLL